MYCEWIIYPKICIISCDSRSSSTIYITFGPQVFFTLFCNSVTEPLNLIYSNSYMSAIGIPTQSIALGEPIENLAN